MDRDPWVIFSAAISILVMDESGQGNGDFYISSRLKGSCVDSLYEIGVQRLLLTGPNIGGLCLFEKVVLSHPESLKNPDTAAVLRPKHVATKC